MQDSDYWFSMAEYDLETARVMHVGGRYLYVGFMCHQTIEKALKGLIVKRQGVQPPYSHNLTLLAEKTGCYGRFSDEQKDVLDMLDPLNIEARYPTYKDQLFKTLSKERCDHIIAATEGLYAWLRLIS
jgi:HEPN domain-containing protein